ncbi:DUF3194 domain-containing protein [Vulcanisaeta thermophila]|uniref:DUF3194 domain-containing protein n=1 Tax=Vulcanisaeta thermophila TaxID=867917 RepID=UPI000853A11F|nr:DUF3194 domain-containing protein [Vulcanisaeta thermophila]
MSNELLQSIANAVAEQVYEYLLRRLPPELIEDLVINVRFTDPERQELEISIDALTNPLLSNVGSIVDEAVEFGFKIADHLMELLRRGELSNVQPGGIEEIARKYAKRLRNNP